MFNLWDETSSQLTSRPVKGSEIPNSLIDCHVSSLEDVNDSPNIRVILPLLGWPGDILILLDAPIGSTMVQLPRGLTSRLWNCLELCEPSLNDPLFWKSFSPKIWGVDQSVNYLLGWYTKWLAWGFILIIRKDSILRVNEFPKQRPFKVIR